MTTFARRPILAAGTAILVSVTLLGATLTLVAPSATAAPDTAAKAQDWQEAASALGSAGSLWEPGRTAGLSRTKPIDVLADGLTFQNGSARSGDTYAGATYGAVRAASTSRPSFTIAEKWADTGWAAEPAYSTSMAPVGSVVIRLGSPGTEVRVTAQVLANCFVQPASANPRPIPAGYRCSKADVARSGGVLRMTARPASTMTAPGRTSIVITTTGLSYAQLVSIASSLEQVSVGGGEITGSAQMVAMCGQMVDGAMTYERAAAFAASNGYSMRVGTIDGVPQMVTMDFRWDRFTVSLVKNLVTSCTYG
jgi:type II secretory pathway pseudopilin PulG